MRTRADGLVAGLAAVVVLGLTGCSSSDNPDGQASAPAASARTPSTQPTPPPTTTAPAIKPLVLAISVDGFNPEAIGLLGPERAPTLHRLMRDGASTLNARSTYELTITLPNHTGMLTGRGVLGSGGHGVTFNDDNGGTLADTHGDYVPGVFDIAHDHGLRTAFFAEKDKFGYLMRSWDRGHGAPDVTGADDGRDKTDTDRIDVVEALIPQVGKALRHADTSLVFLHLAAPDQAGHADGWLSASYLDAVASVDRRLGSILEVVESDPAVRERTTILLTADHGGARGMTSHADATRLANYRVPFIAWGRGVQPGADLYELNPDRTDPGESRPDYSPPQPVRNLDLADTALSLLGLPPLSRESSALDVAGSQ